MSLPPTMVPDEVEVTLVAPADEPQRTPVVETPKRGSAAEISLDDWIAATQSCCGADRDC